MNTEDLIMTDLSTITDFKVQDLAPIEKKEIILSDSNSDQEKLQSDFNIARSGIADVLQHSDEVIKEAISLARASESPRAWEVVATLMKSMADINTQLVDLHGKRADVAKKTAATDGPTTQTNIQNNFMGSTADILELLERQQK